MPPNDSHLCCSDDGNEILANSSKLSSLDFSFDIVPFVTAFHEHPEKSKSPADPTFGLSFEDDPVIKHAFV